MSAALPHAVAERLAKRRSGPVVWLTGAGISAESGIPTFRGPEGYWTIGSRNYQPTELATREAFDRMPEEIWKWYLYRRSICRAAEPNVAHHALAELEARLEDDFSLVTQNVDGLHLRSGNHLERTWQIHGNLEFARCALGCDLPPWPLPEAIPVDWPKDRPLDPDTAASLRCPNGCLARPHVLWFDECYDEVHFRFDSSLAIAGAASLLIIVGTSGATNLPLQMALRARDAGVPLLVIDPESNPFTRLAEEGFGGFLRGTAGHWVPAVCEALV